MVTPAEATAEGVVLVLVEVEIVGGISGLRDEVTSAGSLSLATLVDLQALRMNTDKARVMLSS